LRKYISLKTPAADFPLPRTMETAKFLSLHTSKNNTDQEEKKKTAQNHTISITRKQKISKLQITCKLEKKKTQKQKRPNSSQQLLMLPLQTFGEQEQSEEKLCRGEKRRASGRPTVALKLP
jgi:hypothetical protein